MMKVRLVLLALYCSWLTLSPTPPAAAQASSSDTPAAAVQRDLISIAKREAERESAALHSKVEQLLVDLQSTSDDGIAFVQSRIQSIVAIGNVAIPQLSAAMNPESDAAGTQNAAINAARAMARIAGQPASAALARLAKDGGDHGRRLAAYAIGLRGDASMIPILKGLLDDGGTPVVVAALHGLANIGGPQALPLLRSRMSSDVPQVAAAAIEGFVDAGDASARDAVMARYERELGTSSPNEGVVFAALRFLTKHPEASSIPAVKRALDDVTSTARVRRQAVDALLAAAQQDSRQKDTALAGLKVALQLGPRTVTEAAAMAMNDLGDESGIRAVTADLDAEIDASSKNFNARYKRAEILLRFGKWKSARRDFEAGLKLEKQPRNPDQVYIGLARAYAGSNDYRDAARQLQKLGDVDLSDLPGKYPEFRPMAEEPRYIRVFEKKSP